MKILFSGGGTMGSVTPLLAAAERLYEHDLFFIGTHTGPEKHIVEERGIPFTAITNTKFRRYLSPYQLVLPFQFLLGMCQAWRALRRIRPDVIVGAGSFVDVPVMWIGRLMRIRSIVHQQDLQTGLAIKLVAPFASTITVAFEESLNDFPRAQWIGNPVRDLTPTTNAIALDDSVPTVMIMGGGTGAQGINELVTAKLCEHANVIHVTGRGRTGNMEQIDHPRYHAYEFLGEEMKEALHKADVVVSRAGIGSITELAALKKPAIIIPMPNSHQEKNAAYLEHAGAAVVLHQSDISADVFCTGIVTLLHNTDEQIQYGHKLHAVLPEKATEHFILLITEEK